MLGSRMVQSSLEAQSAETPTRLATPGMQALLLSLLCLESFAGGLSGGFVLDDKHAILEHPVVQGTAPLAEAFRRTFWGEPFSAPTPSFRPLTTLSFALDHRLFGPSAVAFHVSWHYAVVTKARNAFPYAWSHPAREEEQSMPVDQRLREMHRLLHVRIDESLWRPRFETYLRSMGRGREARLVAESRPRD
jgi:hypothetical protein